MNKFNLYVIASAVGLALGAQSMAAELSDAEYASAEKGIEADYASNRAACESLTGNAGEVCVIEAEGKKDVAMAELDARNDSTPEAYFNAQIAKAEAAYAVAKKRCDETTGAANTNCLKLAKSNEEAARAKADSELKTATATSRVEPNTASAPGGSDSHAADTLFDFGSADLRAEGRASLDDFVGKSKENSAAQISVIGHTDRLGDENYNQHLSEQRTSAVKNYLVSQGIDAGRIRTEGKGDAQPTMGANECQGERSIAVIACLQPDRRVVVSMSQVVGSN